MRSVGPSTLQLGVFYGKASSSSLLQKVETAATAWEKGQRSNGEIWSHPTHRSRLPETKLFSKPTLVRSRSVERKSARTNGRRARWKHSFAKNWNTSRQCSQRKSTPIVSAHSKARFTKRRYTIVLRLTASCSLGRIISAQCVAARFNG